MCSACSVDPICTTVPTLNRTACRCSACPDASQYLTAEVGGGGAAYLHDGRARTLAEAILWHGGEAEASKEAFRTMPAADREALIAFLQTL